MSSRPLEQPDCRPAAGHPPRRHRKSIFKKPSRTQPVFKREPSSGDEFSASDSPSPRRKPPVDLFPALSELEPSDAEVAGPFDFEQTRATGAVAEDDPLREARRFPVGPEFERLVSFAEKIDVIFQMICKSEKADSGAAKTSAVAFEILKLKFDELEKREFEFSAKLHKMLAVDSSQYCMVRVANFNCVGLEVRKRQLEGPLYSKEGRPVTFRTHFRQRLVETLWELHSRYLERNGLQFDASRAADWHSGFSLGDVYAHLNYEPAETAEFRRAEEAVRRRQAVLSELDESSREKSAFIRETIVRTVQANEKTIASSSVKERDLLRQNAALFPEIALKLRVLFRVRRVSNMFLAAIVSYFQSKAVLSLFIDEAELVAALREMAARAPDWLSLAAAKGGTVVRMNTAAEMEEVIGCLKAEGR